MLFAITSRILSPGTNPNNHITNTYASAISILNKFVSFLILIHMILAIGTATILEAICNANTYIKNTIIDGKIPIIVKQAIKQAIGIIISAIAPNPTTFPNLFFNNFINKFLYINTFPLASFVNFL